ncbi:TlpA disulfide reductase family protein [Alkalicoccus daliensis]|uniref:Peroxiredoxin n=1 Tax=Alkalicoccus daliensis TaxID=745820 RepID=A0A1H0B003_9BACI|nr:TlpA disulfide reductase family protein [Alkalicoccus daliensis]SDN39047.1 Peroxiredoxin [Alkalicoccus daliensis]
MKKIVSILLLVTAIAAGVFVIYQEQQGDTAENSEALNAYMNQQGIERAQPEENEMISFEQIDETGVTPGMMAREFQLPDLHKDEEIALKDLRGNFVIVNMWATWCPPCRDEMPDFVKFYNDYEDDNLEMIGVNMTATERNTEVVSQFVEDFDIPFYTLLDEEGIMENLYDVYVMPSTYIIDPEGRVVMNRPGYISYDILEENYLEIRENYEAGT